MANVLIIHFIMGRTSNLKAEPLSDYLTSKGDTVTMYDIRTEVDMQLEPSISIYNSVYICGHSSIGSEFIGSVTILGACLWLMRLGCYLMSTVFTLLSCDGAAPVLSSQQLGESLPRRIPVAVKLLNCLRFLGFQKPVIHAYAGSISIMQPTWWPFLIHAPRGSIPAVGQRVSRITVDKMSALSTRSDFHTRIAPHLSKNPRENAWLIQPRYLPDFKFAFSFNSEGLLEVVALEELRSFRLRPIGPMTSGIRSAWS